ncbi:hypothetical protein AB0G73_10710 [Streptomyces sp. NPDC020719]|uniref:hypothetical protein n=1 Tax=Streptomyces sp. NPDC020719 TaxID=3154896 RepID=UPI003405C001
MKDFRYGPGMKLVHRDGRTATVVRHHTGYAGESDYYLVDIGGKGSFTQDWWRPGDVHASAADPYRLPITVSLVKPGRGVSLAKAGR